MSTALTADALVAATGLSKTAIRAHLVRMERDGMIERTSQDAEGPGRPPVAYTLTELGAATFPSDDDVVLTRLLTFLEGNGGSPLVKKFFEQIWSQRMAALVTSLDVDELADADLDTRIAAIEASLAAKNFMPRIERRENTDGTETVTIHECNCPFFAAAKVSRIPCRLEVDFLARALNARPESLSIATNRRERCSFKFIIDSKGAK